MSLKDDKQLLRRLRDMPPPPTPPGLEARLLADVPVHARAGRRRRLLLAAAGVGAIAAGFLVVAVLRPEIPNPPPSPSVLSLEVHPEFVQQTSSHKKETRPWDILPPLERSL